MFTGSHSPLARLRRKIPRDCILQDTALESGLVDARWKDQTISVFLEDLKARGDLMETVSG